MKQHTSETFTYDQETLKEIARMALAHATAKGASAADLDVQEGFGQTVTVRRDEVETIEYNRDKGMSVTAYIGKRLGHASTSDLTSDAVQMTVEAALSIARLTASDDFAALADAELLATEFPDLDLYHPWKLSIEEAVEIARHGEQAAFDADARVSNS